MLRYVKSSRVQIIPGLGQLTKLTHLDVHGCSEIQELPGVESLNSFKCLKMREAPDHTRVKAAHKTYTTRCC